MKFFQKAKFQITESQFKEVFSESQIQNYRMLIQKHRKPTPITESQHSITESYFVRRPLTLGIAPPPNQNVEVGLRVGVQGRQFSVLFLFLCQKGISSFL